MENNFPTTVTNDSNEKSKEIKNDSPLNSNWVKLGFILGLINGIVLFIACLSEGCLFSQTDFGFFPNFYGRVTGQCCASWVYVLVFIFIINFIKKILKEKETEYPSSDTIFYSIIAFLSGITLFILLHLLLEVLLL